MRDTAQTTWTRREAIAAGAAAWAGLCCGSAGARVDNEWIDERQVGPFLCRSSFPLDEALVDLAGLTRLEAELRRVLALRPCRDTIEVLLLPDARAHRRLVSERLPNIPYQRALFVRIGAQSTVFAYRHKDLATDLRHEGTHALLHADLPMVPLWLDEGIAEYFEAPAPERPRGPSHLRAVRWDLRLGRFKSVEQLESQRELSDMDASDYRFAWAWTHFMLHGPEPITQQLWSYMASLRRREPPGDLSARLAGVEPELRRRFAAHFREWPKVLRQGRTA